MSAEGESGTRFLNVDLDLRAETGLDDLLKSLEPSVVVLNRTPYDASVELTRDHDSLEDAVASVIELIQALPPHARAVWDQCEFRRFDIGIQAGSEPHAAHFALSSKAVSLLASVQSEIAVTIYAPPRTQ